LKADPCSAPVARRSAKPAASPLTRARFEKGLQALAARDADLARVTARFGPPPLWRRKPCFATLVRIILEQQVSLASARAVYLRLATMVKPFSAANFRRLQDRHLQQAGLTRQKGSYCRDLADAVASGRLQLKALAAMPDDDARGALMQIKGIGPWTADIYLLMALQRPDIWPRGDLALNNALIKIKNLKGTPPETVLAAIADRWRPWRAVAARILWHYYLNVRGQSAPENF
jgi:DNA-3-methyladenine glycosylase II